MLATLIHGTICPGIRAKYALANMEDVLDEVVSAEDLKVGENCLFFGVFNISAMNVLLLTQLQDFIWELCIAEHYFSRI
jgi:hypothetical protein